jgi:acyl-CoA dehydrogenase
VADRADPVRPFLAERHLALAERARAFVRRQVMPRVAPRDDAAARLEARMLAGMLGAAGAFRSAIPAEHGGDPESPDVRAACVWREALAAASPLADAVFALQALGSAPIDLGGAPAMRAKWLPEIAAGRAIAAFAMTEPAAGSDVAAITTRATRDGAFYVLDGGKHLISNAGIADLYAVFAVTDRQAGTRGISCFLVPARTVGLRFVRAQVMSEPHPLGEIAFDGCRIPASHRLGEEGEGFKLGMRSLDRLRPTVAAAACGFAARALEEALAWARQRQQFGKPIADYQLVQEKLARMATGLDAARLLTYRAAAELDAGNRATGAAAMAKLFATETAQRAVDDAVQILGGRGVLAESPVDRLYRAVRALRIYEGTSEIQHLLIARELLREG